jgi:hypothetical protein
VFRNVLRVLGRNPETVGGIAAGLVLVSLLMWWLVSRQGGGLTVPALSSEEQEIAWLMPATNRPNWDRFLEAARLLVAHSGGELSWASDPVLARGSRDIPGFALARRNGTGRLWFRWYKLTSDYSAEHWLAGLLRRRPKPLAILGGNTSDRALELARLLRIWHDSDSSTPALLLTTATADDVEVAPGEGLYPLLQVYPQRSFRFCFTNRQMADALVDFLSCRPDWLPEDSVWDAITWRDDPYSEDFTNRVSDALLQRNLGQVRKSVVPYSVGEAWLPNVRERQIIEEDLAERIAQTPASPRVLVLPTVERTARRVLIGLGQAAPLTAGQITVVVGDSISFNVVCRDRRLLWPTELLPMRVLLFAHEDPAHLMGTTSPRLAELACQTASAIGKVCGQWPVSIPAFSQLCSRHAATDDLLLWVRILQAVTQAAWTTQSSQHQPAAPGPGSHLADVETFLMRLRNFRNEQGEPFFEADGNRRLGSGEYVVCLQPVRRPYRLDTWAVLEIWHRRPDPERQRSWYLQNRWLLCEE